MEILATFCLVENILALSKDAFGMSPFLQLLQTVT